MVLSVAFVCLGFDQNVLNIDDQFMFGPALMINPIYKYHARSRQVYLPGGIGWYDLISGLYLMGGRIVYVDAPYSDIPIFVKEGSIIPFPNTTVELRLPLFLLVSTLLVIRSDADSASLKQVNALFLPPLLLGAGLSGGGFSVASY